jgi:anti-sigma factor ChrR (cupin superfamily)
MNREKRDEGALPEGAGHGHPNDTTRETAALYALGALTREESDAFEAHVAGCEACAAEVRSFLEITASLERGVSGGGITPSPSVRDELLRRVAGEKSRAGVETQVWKRWSEIPGALIAPGLFTLRASEGMWEETAVPGVAVKPLFVDRERDYVTMLVRMAPGTSYPCHRHGGAEECYVLQGDLHVAGQVLHPGDYQRADDASEHGVQSTEEGCLLLIVSSQHDELL